jgi:PEGA domain
MALSRLAAVLLVAFAASNNVANAERVAAIVVATSDAAIDRPGLSAALASSGVDEPDGLASSSAAHRQNAEPIASLARFAAVATIVAEGWRAYVGADATFAAARLAVARTEAESLVTLDGGLEVYADASLRLGVSLLHVGQLDAADRAMRLAHALDPTRPMTVAEFTPEAVDAFAAAVAVTPVQVSVRVDALAGARVAVDGTEVGVAPLPLMMGLGPHVVVVRQRGYLPRGMAIDVTPTTGLIAVELSPDRGALAVGRAQRDGMTALTVDEAGQVVDEVIAYADVDAVEVVASTVRGGEPALLGQHCSSALRCTAVVEVGYQRGADVAAAVRLLRERLLRAERRYRVSVIDDPRLGRPVVKIGGGCRACRRRWLWIGGAAAVVAVTVAAIVIARSSTGAPVITIDPGDFGGLTAW